MPRAAASRGARYSGKKLHLRSLCRAIKIYCTYFQREVGHGTDRIERKDELGLDSGPGSNRHWLTAFHLYDFHQSFGEHDIRPRISETMPKSSDVAARGIARAASSQLRAAAQKESRPELITV